VLLYPWKFIGRLTDEDLPGQFFLSFRIFPVSLPVPDLTGFCAMVDRQQIYIFRMTG
jgi:hypothetical protein